MNLKGLASAVTQEMRKNGLRKRVSVPKTVFTISGGDGNTRNFTVKGGDKTIIYTVEDVEAVLETCLEVIKKALANGEEVQARGFGKLGVKYFKRRYTRNPQGEGLVEIKAKYVPKFTIGKDLKESALIYAAKVADKFNGELPVDEFDVGKIDDEDGED